MRNVHFANPVRPRPRQQPGPRAGVVGVRAPGVLQRTQGNALERADGQRPVGLVLEARDGLELDAAGRGRHGEVVARRAAEVDERAGCRRPHKVECSLRGEVVRGEDDLVGRPR